MDLIIWSQLCTQQLCCQGGAQGEKLPDLVAFGDSSPSAASDLWAGKQGWPHLSFLGPFPWEGFASTWLPTHCLNSLAFHLETWALHWQFWCFLQLWWLQAVLGLIPWIYRRFPKYCFCIHLCVLMLVSMVRLGRVPGNESRAAMGSISAPHAPWRAVTICPIVCASVVAPSSLLW